MEVKKKEQKTAIKDGSGKILEDEDSIKQRYQEFYTDLLQTPVSETLEGKQREIEINETFESILKIANYQDKRTIDIQNIIDAVKQLKRRKAGDRDGWQNEMILEGGTEMNYSILHMFNQILEDQKIPSQWKEMTIKSIHKKGSKLLMENRRGLFLTNILSKLFERVLENVTREEIQMSQYQSGGQRKRGTCDNQIMMNAVIDQNRRLKKKTYLYFADAYKCFDRLWLKDCLVELWKAGMREREIKIIYEMNRLANIEIKTPNGITKEILVNDIVRQGTIFGPKLSCISTQNVNNLILPMKTVISPEIEVEAPVYVDDILGVGNKDTVEKAIKNTSIMEQRRKFKFNPKKSKYMVINSGSGQTERIEGSVQEGPIEETNEYKYLGFWITQKHTIMRQIEANKAKLVPMIREIKHIGNENKVGAMNAQIQKLLYETTVIPAVIYNMEVMTNVSKKEYDELEKIQKTALTEIYNLPLSTPYWGILFETGIWPLKYMIIYRQMMLYRDIMRSSDNRKTKQILTQQKKYKHPRCLYSEIEANAYSLKLDLNEIDDNNIKKSDWKKMVKRRILNKINKESYIKNRTMKKLRFLQNSKFGEKDYVKRGNLSEISKILLVKLNMINIGSNYGKPMKCPKCEEDKDLTTEHLLTCQRRDSRIFTEIDLEETKKEEILLTVNEIETKLDELNLKQHEISKDTYNIIMCKTGAENEREELKKKKQEIKNTASK